MDTDLIAAIAGVLLAVFIGWAERAAAGKTRKGKPAARKTPKPVRQQPARKVQHAAAPKPAPARKAERPAAVATAPAPFLDSSAEGARIPRSALKEESARRSAGIDTPRPRIAHPSKNGLRNAVIWGEILRRKY